MSVFMSQGPSDLRDRSILFPSSKRVTACSSKAKPKDVVRGFETGGNDYLKKPFSIEELLVRMKVLLNDKRLLPKGPPTPKTFRLGRYTLDIKKRRLSLDRKEHTQLTTREADLLQLFCLNQNELLRKETILLQIWEDDAFLNSRSMDVFISRLRKYLNRDPDVEIVNQRGVGYRLVVHGRE